MINGEIEDTGIFKTALYGISVFAYRVDKVEWRVTEIFSSS